MVDHQYGRYVCSRADCLCTYVRGDAFTAPGGRRGRTMIIIPEMGSLNRTFSCLINLIIHLGEGTGLLSVFWDGEDQ